MRIKGIGEKRKLKDAVKEFSTLCKIMRGKKLKKKMPEKALEKKIILTLKMLGFYVYKTASAGSCYDYNLQFNDDGITDLIVLGGKNITTFMEVKIPSRRNHKNGGLSDKQVIFRDLCKEKNVPWALVYSTGEAVRAMEE